MKKDINVNQICKQRLRRVRELYNMSGTDLAKAIGSSRQYIANLENLNSSATIGKKTALKISKVLPVNPDYLTGESDNPNQYTRDFHFLSGAEYFKNQSAVLSRFISHNSEKFLIRSAEEASQDPINSAGRDPEGPGASPWCIEDMDTGLSYYISPEEMADLFNAVLEYAEMYIDNHMISDKAAARIRRCLNNETEQGYLDLYPEQSQN